MCADLQLGWIDALFLCSDSALWRMGRSGRGKEAGMADRNFVSVCTGDQTAEAFPTGERGAPLVIGQCRRIPLASESKWLEREH